MNIGIIGAGAVGATLARGLVELGHRVSIANSRGPRTLNELASQMGAQPAPMREATRTSDVVILAIPTKAMAELPTDLFAGVPSSVIVVDTSNYHPRLRDGQIEALDAGLPESEWVAAQLGRPVVKAFNNILATNLFEKRATRGSPERVALSVVGDSPSGRAAVLQLVDALGFEPVDGGGLGESWRQQTGTPAYCRDLDASSLKRALADADRSRLSEYRRAREEQLATLMAAAADPPPRANR